MRLSEGDHCGSTINRLDLPTEANSPATTQTGFLIVSGDVPMQKNVTLAAIDRTTSLYSATSTVPATYTADSTITEDITLSATSSALEAPTSAPSTTSASLA